MSTTVEEIEKTETSENKKSELLLDSLEIKGYRCFEHLTIEKLGRVNLIVGKNNAGKTALLEALYVWAEGTSWHDILRTMDEVLSRRNEKISGEAFEKGAEFRHLFFNRPKEGISIFKISNKRPLSSDYASIIAERSENFVGAQLTVNPNGRIDISEMRQTYGHADYHYPLQNLLIKSSGLETDYLTQIWDEIILRNQEDDVVESLRIITPKIVDLNFIGYPKGAEKRVPVVRVKDINERVPLNSLGEGMYRLLGLALALAECKSGLLLIDEVEIGLHYSALPDIWQMIFKTAKDLNVQVFATTHSKDCIEAFAQAAVDSPEDGMLIQLIRQGEKIIAKNIEEDRLAEALNYEVEVR